MATEYSEEDAIRALGLPTGFKESRTKSPGKAKRKRSHRPSLHAYQSHWITSTPHKHLLAHPRDTSAKCSCGLFLDDPTGEDKLHLYKVELDERLYKDKQQFDDIPIDQFKRSRTATNPYESLGKGSFVCRSAVKLVELQHVIGLFENKSTSISPFTWVDVCGGPGGFSEYVGWWHRTQELPHMGWGMTLKGVSCDWHAPMENFTTTYGADGTGDVYKAENVRHLAELVLGECMEGVQLVLGDGGFPEARNLHDQEAAMARLVTAQMVAMAMLLAEGGSWVCKVFSIHHAYTAGLVALAARVFQRVCIIKPLSSRPASAERYIVGKGFHKQHGPALAEHLLALLQCTHGTLPMSVRELAHEAHAMKVVREANNHLLHTEIHACEAITKHLHGEHQRITRLNHDERRQLLENWGIADAKKTKQAYCGDVRASE